MGVLINTTSRIRYAHLFKHIDSSLAGLLGSCTMVDLKYLRELPCNSEVGIQRGQRILKDHGQLITAELLHLVFGESQKVSPLKLYVTRGMESWRCWYKSKCGQASNTFPRSAFTHEAKCFSFMNGKIYAINGFDNAIISLEVSSKVSNLKEQLFPAEKLPKLPPLKVSVKDWKNPSAEEVEAARQSQESQNQPPSP